MKRKLLYVVTLMAFISITGCAKTWQAAPFPNQSLQLENPEKARVYLICDTNQFPIFVFLIKPFIFKLTPRIPE